MNLLSNFLKPGSVAIIGASRDPSKRGNRAIQNLLDFNYGGRIVPINPRESEILGLPCYPELAAVPFDIDLALVCTPAAAAPEVIELCGQKGVKGAMVLAGGFSEAGPEGAALEARMLDTARRHGVRIIGPNTHGMLDGHTGCNLCGWPGAYAGGLGVLSQSGNVALSIFGQSLQNGHAGFSTLLGVGNESDILFHEYLRFFADDPNTQAVIVYAEGFKNGRAFLDVAREVAPRKPIVLYKAGRTSMGEKAARSHSGSLAGDYAVATGALRQAGVILVERSDEMFPVADMLTRTRGRPTRRVAVLSEGGGPISQAADALAERGLELPRLSAETEARLKKITPAATQLSNPVDAGGGTDPHPRYFPPSAREILSDPAVDALLIVGYFGGYTIRFGDGIAEIQNAAAREMVAIAAETNKVVIVQCHFAEFPCEALDILRAGGIVVVRSIEIAAACLAGADRFQGVSATGRNVAAAAAIQAPAAAASRIVAEARARGRTSLLETEALDLLAAHGIPVPQWSLLKTPGDAAELPAALLAVPVALKVVSKDVLHKSEVGGVRLGISGPAAIKEEAAALLADVRRHRPNADITGVLVAPMAPKGVEVIIGTARDPQYGPALMFGLGGIFVEVLKDVTFRSLPIDRVEAGRMLDEIRGRAVLEGSRGARPVDREQLISLLLSISGLALAHPEIAEIDLNPVIANAEGFSIADARILLA